MGLLIFVVIGISAGLIARALAPAHQRMGLFGSVVLGVIGAVVGGFVSSLIFTGGRGYYGWYHPGALFLSIIGALAVLVIGGAFGRRRAFR